MTVWRGMNEGRKREHCCMRKSRQDVKLAALLFMSSLEVESSGTDAANLYELIKRCTYWNKSLSLHTQTAACRPAPPRTGSLGPPLLPSESGWGCTAVVRGCGYRRYSTSHSAAQGERALAFSLLPTDRASPERGCHVSNDLSRESL